MQRNCFLVVFFVLSVAWAPTVLAQPADLNYQPRVVLQQPLPAITDAPIVVADQAQVALNDLVIGVAVNGLARAYPVNQLTGPRREIINDRLGDLAIAATW